MPNSFNIKQFPGFTFVMGPNFMTQFVYMTVMPVFFIAYCLIYNPFDIIQYYKNAPLGAGFNILMIACIILLSLGITRSIFAILVKRITLNRWHYLMWCIGELFVVSSFTALYTLLMLSSREGYLAVLKDCMKIIYLILVHPYILILLVRTIMSKNQEIELIKAPRENDYVKFYDEHKHLKLTIDISSILYIKSDLNYVIIYYIESGKTKEFQLRCSMKSIEGIANDKYLVRCHRSYFINPQHISVLRKDKDGFIFAELNVPELRPVPVSKSYYQAISVLL